MNPFLNRLVRAGSLLVCLALASCASGPAVHSNHDPSVDFSAYSTFGFFEELGTDRGGYSTLISDYFREATRREMEALGYTYTETNPELKVNFFTNVREESDVRSSTRTSLDMGYSYYAYRNGRYVAFPMYSYRIHPETVTVHYRVGTANIDVVDSANNRLIWEGVAEGRLGNNVLEQAESLIHEAVAEIFRQYPLNRDR